MKDGIHEHLSNEEYHVDREHVSSSGLKFFPHKIDEYIARYVTGFSAITESKSVSDALVFGSAVHAAILEPDKYEERYIVAPEINRQTKEGKAEYAQFLTEAEGKTVISQTTQLKISDITHSVLLHPVASKLLICAKNEMSFFLEHDGIKQKVRPDSIKGNVIVDLKTTADDVSKFSNSVVIYGYHFSEAMYTEIISATLNRKMKFFFVVVQKTLPYTTMVCELDEGLKKIGKDKYALAKESFRDVMETGNLSRIEQIHAPDWFKSNNLIQEY